MKLMHRVAAAAFAAVVIAAVMPAHFAFAEETDPDVLEALETGIIATPAQRAKIYMQNEEWQKLAAHADKWTREFPGESEAWRYLGRAQRAQNALQAAAESFSRAWELSDRRNFRIIESVGDVYAEIKEWERAESAYREALALRPRRAALWTKLADILFLLRNEGWEREAARALKTALSFGEYINDLERWRQYAEILDATNAAADARYAAHRHVVRLNVRDAATWEKLYDIERERGKPKETAKIARILSRIDSQNAVANLHFGMRALEEGRIENAVAFLQTALKRGELSGERRSSIYMALGDTYSDPARALPFYRNAVDSDPSNFAAWEQAIVMLRGLNRRDEAQAVYEQLLAAERKLKTGGEIARADAGALLDGEEE